MSKAKMFIQFQLVVITSAPSRRKRNRGRRLIKKASCTAALAFFRGQSAGREGKIKSVSRGAIRTRKTVIMLDATRRGVEVIIATTWSCTKSFWFLRPMDELLSFSSCE